MQFMPATWKTYGVDGNNDGLMDPYNPVDAIFAYNHADWYVDSVLLRAQLIGGLPSNLVGSLTGLTEGRFPVAAQAS
jgi:membrane-bound lytic murein transglycosylase B